MMLPIDDDLQSILEWCERNRGTVFWTEYLALLSGVYQEQTGKIIDHGTRNVEAAIYLIDHPQDKNQPVWLE